MKSLGAALDESKGIGHGFDFLRIFLAISILFMHSITIAQNISEPFSNPHLAILHDALVPMFFALSGFLITGSALRLSLKDFLINRSMRIVPALAVDIVFAALILGPLFTNLGLMDYFSNFLFHSYFFNIVGLMQYNLPGVFFHGGRLLAVNASLWTVPFEIACYAIMSLLIIFGLLKRPNLALLVSAIAIAAIIWIIVASIVPAEMGGRYHQYSRSYTILDNFLGRRGMSLYISFLLGVLFYLFRHRVPKHWAIAVASFVAPFAMSFAYPALPGAEICTILSPALTYLTVYVGLLKIPPLPLYRHGDYSYGIYLYGYPFQRAITEVFPGLTSSVLHFAVSLVLSTLVALGSWHFIEKPILKLRRKFSFTARKGEPDEVIPHPESVVVAVKVVGGMATPARPQRV